MSIDISITSYAYGFLKINVSYDQDPFTDKLCN
jgi:hypothetical protein